MLVERAGGPRRQVARTFRSIQSHPAKRLAFILDDADAPVLIADRAADGLFPSYRGQLVWLDSDWDAIAHEDPGNLTARHAPGAGRVCPLHVRFNRSCPTESSSRTAP